MPFITRTDSVMLAVRTDLCDPWSLIMRGYKIVRQVPWKICINSLIRNSGMALRCLVEEPVGFQTTWIELWCLFLGRVIAPDYCRRPSAWVGYSAYDVRRMPNKRGRQKRKRRPIFFLFRYFADYDPVLSILLFHTSLVHPAIIFREPKSVNLWSLSTGKMVGLIVRSATFNHKGVGPNSATAEFVGLIEWFSNSSSQIDKLGQFSFCWMAVAMANDVTTVPLCLA